MNLIHTARNLAANKMEGKLKKYWNPIIEKFKQNYSCLENIDSTYRDGSEDELIDILKDKTSQSREEILYQMYIIIDKIEKEQ